MKCSMVVEPCLKMAYKAKLINNGSEANIFLNNNSSSMPQNGKNCDALGMSYQIRRNL